MTDRDPSQRIVVTGMGIAAPTANGFTPEGFWSDLKSGRHGVRRIDDVVEPYKDKIETRIGAPLARFVLKDLLDKAGFNTSEPNIHKETRSKWDRSVQVQVWTGSQALRQAGLLTSDSLKVDEKQLNPKKFGIYQGTGIAGSLNLVEIYKILSGDGKRPQVSPHDILLFLGGRVDEVPSMTFNAQRFNDTEFTECAASLSAIDRAMDDLRLGRANVVLAGGVETAAHPVTIAAFEATKALSSLTDPETAPLMFTDPENESLNTKIGLVLGEGGGSVVLETLEYAMHRKKLGAEVVILAEILGTGKSADAYKDTLPSEDGASMAIDYALEDAGLTAEELTNLYIQTHATGTAGDITEFRTVAKKFPKQNVRGISSIKVDTGHTFGAAGVLSTITVIHALRDRWMPGHRTMTDENRAPETIGWPMLPGRGKAVEKLGYAVVNSFGFGGKNRVAIIAPHQEK